MSTLNECFKICERTIFSCKLFCPVIKYYYAKTKYPVTG